MLLDQTTQFSQDGQGVVKRSAPKRKTKERRNRRGWDEPGKERERCWGSGLRNTVINILNGVLTV